MNTAKHTPGPLRTRKPSLGQPCTCCILLRTGEPLESIHGDRTCSDISRIELCPLHAAAPAMYAALQIMVRAANVDEIDPLVMFASIERAKGALAQAEGRQ